MRGAIVAAGLAALVSGIAAQDLLAQQDASRRRLEISFDLEGRVTLVAENVTIREVLAEWGRVGGSYVINAEKLAGGPVPMLRFENRPEREVIDSLLRTAAGYILGPRTARTAGPSLYETVMILPTSSPLASGAYPFSAGPAVPLRTPGAPEEEIPPVVPAVGVPSPEPPAAPAPNPAVNTTPGVFVPIVPVTPVTGGPGRGAGS